MPGETLHQVFEKLGQIDGSVREMKHAANGLAMKVEAVNTKVDNLALAIVKQDEMRRDVVYLQTACREHDDRITTLETDKHRREGAIGLLEWLGQHWPFTVVSSLIITAVLWVNGKFG